MKKFYADNYNKIAWLLWTIFVFLLWLQYIHLSSVIEATLMLTVLLPIIVISHILANVWLPKALHKKRVKAFILLFLGVTFFNAFLLSACYQLIRWAGIEGYIMLSEMLEDNKSLMIDILFAIPSTLVINLGFCGLRFFYENIKLQKVNLETQIQMLQSQINPHFMFNVLNHIHVLMQTNVELASELLLQYSEMLRFQLYKGKSDKVCLEEEVQFMINFVEIEKLRWGDKLSVKCDWDLTNRRMEIPPLLLFPFIENAFKYASRSIGESGFVKIGLKQNSKGFTFQVKNSKSANNALKKTEASGIGLSNTQKRLNLLFGENHRLTIKEEKNTYYLELDVCLK